MVIVVVVRLRLVKMGPTTSVVVRPTEAGGLLVVVVQMVNVESGAAVAVLARRPTIKASRPIYRVIGFIMGACE